MNLSPKALQLMIVSTLTISCVNYVLLVWLVSR